MKTTGKYSVKSYKCNRCGAKSLQGTNHWGSIYNLRCKKCSWKKPMDPFVTMSCQTKMPKGYKKPQEWTKIKLGDLMK